MPVKPDDIQDGKKPRGKVRKRWAIEWRWRRWNDRNNWSEWKVCRRYETKKQRDQALADHLKKRSDWR